MGNDTILFVNSLHNFILKDQSDFKNEYIHFGKRVIGSNIHDIEM